MNMKKSKNILANYHTHTARCMHAVGGEEDYIKSALQGGFSVLGFSDHCPWNYGSDFVSCMRMEPDELAGYCASLRHLKEKYRDRMHIYLGLECEYFPLYMDWQLQKKEELGLDYLILGNHYDLSDETGMYFGAATRPKQILRYTKLTVRAMRTGHFIYLAHPDLPLNVYPRWDDACEELCETLCDAALETGMPLEYNVLGYQRRLRSSDGVGYTTDRFWQIAAARGCTAIVGQDAHSPEALRSAAPFVRAQEYLTGLGIPLLYTLPGLE